jgi:hypothetical protein
MNTLFFLIHEILVAASLQVPAAEEVMNKSRELSLVSSMSATIELIIKEKNGTMRKRTISILTASDTEGQEKRLVKFLEPAEVRGTSMLIIDNKKEADDMWIYLPALKKTRRIVASEKGRSFMNSEFSNSDMSSPPLSDFVSRHAENSGNDDQWIIESIPSGEDKIGEYGFSRKLTYISRQTFQVSKIVFYNSGNEVFKEIDVLDKHQLQGGKYIISAMKVRNLENGRSSEISFSNIKTGISTDKSWFTIQALER